MNQIKLILFSVLFLLLSACASLPDTDGGSAETETETAASYTEDEWSDEVLFQLQAAAHGGFSEDHDQVLKELLATAGEKADVELVQQAVGLAWRMQRWALLQEAAGLWRQLDPDTADARRLEILAALNQGRSDKAVELAARWLSRDNESRERLLRRDLVQVIAAAEGVEDRSAVLDEVISKTGIDRESGAALAARSQLYWQMDQPEQAYEAALKAAALTGERADLTWAAQLATALDDYPEALVLYRQARQTAPEEWTLGLAEAEVLRNLERLDDALEVLSELPLNPDVLYSIATYRFQAGDERGAAEAWQQLAAWSPVEDADQHAFMVAWLAEFLERPADAAQWYARVRGGSNVDRAMIRRAVLLADDGKLDEARGLLQLARDTEQADQRERAFLVEAELLREHGNEAQGLRLLGDALRESPGSIRLLYARAIHAVESDDLELAEQDLRRIIQIDSDNAMALNALGYTLTDRTHRHREAYRLIRRALELEPDEPAILDSMGWVYFRLGRPETALPYLERALDGEDNPEIAAHLVEVLWVLEQRERATELLRDALVRHPDDQHLDDTRHRLEISL